MNYQEALAGLLSELTGLNTEQLLDMLEVPPQQDMGDYALPCFKLSKTLRKAPPIIAKELSEKLEQPDYIEKIEVAGGYLNFFIKKQAFAKTVLEEVLSKKEAYGSSDFGQGRKVVIDYSSINIAKPFHIGHLFTTALGNSLYRIYNFLGFESVGINHLGDWGTQFGKLISAYKRWGDHDEVEKGSIHALLALYVRFHKEAEENKELEEEGREWFKKIEEGDKEALALFQWFKDLTLREVSKVYDLLDIHFDSYAGESFYNDKMQPVIDELNEKHLLKKSEGAYVVDLEEYNMSPFMIIKSNGTTLYATRDLAAAFYRKKTYDFYKCLYVVAYQQNLHFKQLFKTIELMGYDWYKDMEHVNFGMVSLTEGTLSTRSGRVVFLQDVLDQAIAKTRALIEEKSPDLAEKETVAKEIGVGAVLFSVLTANRIKDIVFDFDRVLNFDGETGPYIQYTHARATSVLRKAGDAYDKVEPDYSALDNGASMAVLRLIQEFPEVIFRAMEKNEPSIITRHIILLAQTFNRFYFEQRILDDNKADSKARLMLVSATATVLKTGLSLLGIKAPDRM